MYLFLCIVNIALHKPAFQQYPFIEGEASYDANRAVDGLKSDLSWSGGQCVLSSGRHTATWWVNLTSILSIHHITIYYRTDNVEPGILMLNRLISICFKQNSIYFYFIGFFFRVCSVHKWF